MLGRMLQRGRNSIFAVGRRVPFIAALQLACTVHVEFSHGLVARFGFFAEASGRREPFPCSLPDQEMNTGGQYALPRNAGYDSIQRD